MKAVDQYYARSDGWAASLGDKKQLRKIGEPFFWLGYTWEVSGHFPFPCCGHVVALVRKVGSGLNLWSGLACPECEAVGTYSVERQNKT